MPIWHVNACYIVFYFLRKVKPLRRKWTKKGKNAESAMFFISTVLSRRPKVSSLRLISINFVRFLSSPLSFFHKTIDGYSSTAAGLATGKHRAYVGGTLAANPLSCLPIYTANLFLRAAADTQMLSEATTEAMQNGAKPAPFCFCLLPSSISKYSTTNDLSLMESSRYIRKIKWLL